MTRKILSAALVAVALLGAAPVEAGGTFGVTISAKSGEERRAINRFLRFYATGSTAVEVIQNGTGNAAAVSQRGSGNRTVVSQQGRNHGASVNQRGRGNRLGVFQFGEGTNVNVTQTGRRGSTLIFMGGW